jgi:predicted TIM-barrel fold metal-dependent hydrolase
MIPLLDTHQHLVYPDNAKCSWTDDISVLADRAFTVSDYQDLVSDKNIIGSLFMETGVDDKDYQAEARFVANLIADPTNKILAMIASCRPEFEVGFDAWLDECAELPVVGFRRILHVVDDDLSKGKLFRSNVRKLGNRNLTFDMCFLARQLPIAVEFAKACDNTSLILNHCGVPDIANGKLDAWKKGISALAALPNVSCKISGVMAYCVPGTAALQTVRPCLDHVVAAFGAERLVWGSDWPVVNMANGIEDWIAVTRKFLENIPAEEAEKIAHLNASKIYQLRL